MHKRKNGSATGEKRKRFEEKLYNQPNVEADLFLIIKFSSLILNNLECLFCVYKTQFCWISEEKLYFTPSLSLAVKIKTENLPKCVFQSNLCGNYGCLF